MKTLAKKILILMMITISLSSIITPIWAAEVDPIVYPGPEIYYDDQRVVFSDQLPVIYQGRTLVPVRGIFETMGAKVDWYSQIRYVELSFNNHYINIYIDNPLIRVSIPDPDNQDGYITKEYLSDVAPQIIGDRTMVPLRILSELMNMEVNWQDNKVYINQKEASDPIVLWFRNANETWYYQRIIDPLLYQGQPLTPAVLSDRLNMLYSSIGTYDLKIDSISINDEGAQVNLARLERLDGMKIDLAEEEAILDSITQSCYANLKIETVWLLKNGKDYRSDYINLGHQPWQLIIPINHPAQQPTEPSADTAELNSRGQLSLSLPMIILYPAQPL